MITPRFSDRDDGQVDVSLGPGWDLFTDALNDSVSSLPPRGAAGEGPSTYWIDLAQQGALRAAATGDDAPFTWGNSTLLRVRGDVVVAAYDYAPDDEQEIPLEDFLALLEKWRRRVKASAEKATRALPETYRRNPIDKPAVASSDPPEEDLGDPLLGGSLSPGAKRVLGVVYLLVFTVVMDLGVFLFFGKVPPDQMRPARQLSLTMAIAGGMAAAILVARSNTRRPSRPAAVAIYAGIGYSSYVFLRPFPVIRTGVYCFLAAFCTVACLWAVATSMKPDVEEPESD